MTLENSVRARDDRSPAHSVSGVSVNRRSMLMNIAVGTIASATALASPSAMASVDDDPIFGVLAAYAQAEAELEAAAEDEDEDEGPALDESMRLLSVVIATIPTSADGVIAFMDFMRSEMFGEAGRYHDDIEEVAWETLSDATMRLAGTETPAGGRRVSPLEAAPADPIFAAISAHRAAMRAYEQALLPRSRLKDYLPEVRVSPEYMTLVKAVENASKDQYAAAVALLEVSPATIAGAVALLRHADQAADYWPEEFRHHLDAHVVDALEAIDQRQI